MIKEIDKKEVRNLIDFGKAVKVAMKECNFRLGPMSRRILVIRWGGREFPFRRVQAGLTKIS